MSIYSLKPRFQALLRPVTRALARMGVTANQVTILAAVLSVALGAAMAWRPEDRRLFLLIAPWLFVRMALNAIDGMLAREHGQKSSLGGLLNELGDVVADAALYLPFALVPGFHPGLVAVVVVLAVVTEMTGVVCVQIGASRRYDGPFGKSDRAFAFGGLGLLVGAGVPSGTWVTFLLVAMVALLMGTTLNRARRGLAERRSESGKAGV